MAPTSEPEKRVEPPLEALRALPEEEKARLRDEALRELEAEGEPFFFTRRGRLVQLVIAVIIFLALFFALRARREQPLHEGRPDVR